MKRIARLGFVVSLLLSATWALGLKKEGQEGRVIQNWTAPPYWHADQGSSEAHGMSARSVAGAASAVATLLPFVAMNPCRLADTRGPGFSGLFGPPSLAPGVFRNFPVGGNCGVPSDAAAVSFNFTVVLPQGTGYLVAFPKGAAAPATSNLNFVAGQVVANFSVVQLGAGGELTTVVIGAQTDLIIDINGYYGGKIVSTVNALSGNLLLAGGTNLSIATVGNTMTLNASSVPGPTGPSGPQGPQGIQGPIGPTGNAGLAATMILKGPWDGSETIYALNDAVFFDGSSYVSLISGNSNHQPDTSPSQWALLAQAGAAGTNGTNGATGATGATGPTGPSVLAFQSSHMLNGTTLTVYLSPIESKATAPSAPETGEQIAHLPFACTMTTISVFVTSPLDAATTETYTLRAGTAFSESTTTSDLTDRSLSCTIGHLAHACSTTTGTIAMDASDIFDIRLDITGTAPGLHHATVALICE